jgi:hypothetical protein
LIVSETECSSINYILFNLISAFLGDLAWPSDQVIDDINYSTRRDALALRPDRLELGSIFLGTVTACLAAWNLETGAITEVVFASLPPSSD